MGKPCNAALAQNPLGDNTIDKLYDSPKSDNNQGRHPHDLPEEPKDKEGVDPGMWKKKEVGAEHPGNSAACPDHRNNGRGFSDGMGIGSRHSGNKVEGKEAEMPQAILYVVAEYPEVEHIASYVEEPAMKKHGGEDS